MGRNHNGYLNHYSRKHAPPNDSGNEQGTPAQKRPTLEKRFQPLEKKTTFADLGGCEPQLLEATRLALHLKFPQIHTTLGVVPPKGFLLHGPPGTGKSTFARAVAGEFDLPLYSVSSTELVAGISGESERRIRELFSDAASTAPSIIHLDDIDVIAGKRENAQREMERRIVAQLIASLDELDNGQVLVIGTTSRAEVLDASLRRAGRFDRELALGIPDERCRFKILEIVTKGLKMGEDVSLQHLARLTPGYVGADLRALVSEASLCAVNRKASRHKLGEMKANRIDFCDLNDLLGVIEGELLECDQSNEIVMQTPSSSHYYRQDIQHVCTELDKMLMLMKSTDANRLNQDRLAELCVQTDDFIRALSIVLPSAKREGFATVPDVTWANIGALKSIRDELEWSILNPIQQPESFEILAANPRAQGILLCGPPGCGKTLLAKAIANETGMNFISVKGPELLSMYVGESERAVRTVFQRARDSSPCVIFFDEIDALCPKRSSTEVTGSARLVNQLLTEMDGMEARKQVFLIGATNRPDVVDPAILRPGRFDKVLFVDFPNAEDRADILRKSTKNGERPRIDKSIDFDHLAKCAELEFFTGADLVALIHEAGVIALKERIEHNLCIECLQLRHFEAAMKKLSPSVNVSDRERYAKLRKQYVKKELVAEK